MMTRSPTVPRAVLLLIGTIVLAGPERIKTSMAEEPAYIPDPDLKAAIEQTLSVSNPTPSQIASLDWLVVQTEDWAVDDLGRPMMETLDLRGLEYAENLSHLYLANYKVLDFTPVSALPRLGFLRFLRCGIDDISPLVRLEHLTNLFFEGGTYMVIDLSVISRLTALQVLEIRKCGIGDISALSSLTKLNTLDLSHNNISDLSPLLGLTKLQRLDLNYNPLNDGAFTLHIPAIVKNNPGLSLNLVLDTPIVWVLIQSTRGGAVVRPGQGRLPFKSGTLIIVQAQPDPGYPFLGWTGTAVSSGRVADPGAAVTLMMLDEDCTLVANFKVPGIIYVDANARGGNNGSSWRDAYRCLQDALAAASHGDEIRVAKGTYKPDIGAGIRAGDQNAFFHLKSDVSVKGGHAGSWARDPNARNPKLNPTILSGDLQGNDASGLTLNNIAGHASRSDNSFHVVATTVNDTNCVLDGFTISGGHDMSSSLSFGGGLYCVPKSNSVVRNCTFSRNFAGNGGAVACRGGSIVLEGCNLIGNMSLAGGGLLLMGEQDTWTGASAILKDCTFTGNSVESYGGAVANLYNHLEMTGCSFTENSGEMGGAIYACGFGFVQSEDQVRMTDCAVGPNNGPKAIETHGCNVRILGTVSLESGLWDAVSTVLKGDGTFKLGGGATLRPGMESNLAPPCLVDCNISGEGAIELPVDARLTVQGQAHIDVARIDCSGLLRLRDRAQIVNTRITTRRVSFEDDVIVSNSVIVAEAGAPYGQFFIEQTAHVGNNKIYADGDRYMDLDPTVFAGLIENNRIHVTVTEGVGNKRGGLFELRGRPGMGSETTCDANNPFLCRIGQVPKFDSTSWMIEELRLVDGAQLNLTNRFDFQAPYDEGGNDEVLYVRNLHLGKDSVLNTSFNRIYYENLDADPSAEVKNVPLLGFSLNNIGFDDDDEFAIRVATNNLVHDDPSLKQYDRIGVHRVTGRAPDPCGVMEMRNLRDIDPDSPTFEQNVFARAKGLFAKSNEQRIQIKFEYLFTNPQGGAAIMIYLSNIPELPGRDDPIRRERYLEVARLWQPPAGRPGSAGSGRWGVFDKVVSVGHLSFVRGTRIELELVGPEGTCVWINNFDPAIQCTSVVCGDVAMEDTLVNAIDFLAVLSECGRRIDATIGCLDGFFCADGYVTVDDALAVDWVNKKSLCPDERPPSSRTSTALAYQASMAAGTPAALSVGFAETQDFASLQGITGQFLVSAKMKFKQDINDILTDRLYGLDSNGTIVSGPVALADDNDRYNGKLVRDKDGAIYQLNLGRGLVRISDNQVLVGPGSLPADWEPHYQAPADIYIGFQEARRGPWGRPLLDAAFDSVGYVYVAPVVVIPALGPKYAYAAAAKLKLNGTDYSLVHLLYDPQVANDNQDPNHVREVEVDDANNVYVLNCYYCNSSDILWKYDSDGRPVARKELQEIPINAPTGLCVSSHDPSRLYLASSEHPPDANTVKLYKLSTEDLSLTKTIEIHNMGHVTDITEDPATGIIYVVGFKMPQIPSNSELQDTGILDDEPFYKPCLAMMHAGDNGPIEAMCPIKALTPTDMALPLSVICVEGAAGNRGEGQ